MPPASMADYRTANIERTPPFLTDRVPRYQLLNRASSRRPKARTRSFPLSGQVFLFRGRRGDLIKFVGTTASGRNWQAACNALLQKPHAFILLNRLCIGVCGTSVPLLELWRSVLPRPQNLVRNRVRAQSRRIFRGEAAAEIGAI